MVVNYKMTRYSKSVCVCVMYSKYVCIYIYIFMIIYSYMHMCIFILCMNIHTCIIYTMYSIYLNYHRCSCSIVNRSLHKPSHLKILFGILESAKGMASTKGDMFSMRHQQLMALDSVSSSQLGTIDAIYIYIYVIYTISILYTYIYIPTKVSSS